MTDDLLLVAGVGAHFAVRWIGDWSVDGYSRGRTNGRAVLHAPGYGIEPADESPNPTANLIGAADGVGSKSAPDRGWTLSITMPARMSVLAQPHPEIFA
jgi:hypothetical protein